ncbi:MAG: hypothetical protein COA86_03730 [Kangiella sp.]|nr:MAG: hypothetical protein COA86_05080 [Kangiella sp.]PHS19872.1 MAG: hypothetical protein COA86_03730 [Kangiella sp.]
MKFKYQLRGATLLFVLIVFGKLSGFLKDVEMTYFHGVSDVTDAFFLAVYISSLLYIAIYASIPIVIVPLYSKLNESQNVSTNLGSVYVIYLIMSISLALLVFTYSADLVSLFGSQLNSEVTLQSSYYLKLMAVTFPLSTIVAFANAQQTVKKTIFYYYLVPLVNNVVFCVTLVIYQENFEFHYILIASIFAWLLLCIVNLYSEKLYIKNFWLVLTDLAKLRNAFVLTFPALLSLFAEQLNNFIGIIFASKLGDGAVSIYSYSNKLNLLILSVTIMLITTHIYPKLNEIVSRNERGDMSSFLNFSLNILLIIIFPVVVYFSYYSYETVSLIFRRGDFSDNNAVMVAEVFRVFIVVIPLVIFKDILIRMFFARGNSGTAFFISFAVTAINFTICYRFYQEYLLVGVVVAYLISLVVGVILLLVVKWYRERDNLPQLLIKTFSSRVVIVLVAIFSISLIEPLTQFYWLFYLPIYIAIYIGLLFILKDKSLYLFIAYLNRYKIT